jgi:hypothetical protein
MSEITATMRQLLAQVGVSTPADLTSEQTANPHNQLLALVKRPAQRSAGRSGPRRTRGSPPAARPRPSPSTPSTTCSTRGRHPPGCPPTTPASANQNGSGWPPRST